MRFIDSNIWLYAIVKGPDAGKRQRALSALQAPGIVVSTQVVNEVCFNLIRKWGFDSKQIRRVIEAMYRRALVLPLDDASMRKACVLRDSYSFGFWDSQLVACAILGGCEVLESEDMQDGLIVDGSLLIRNILK